MAGEIPDILILTEHRHVYTIGRSGDPHHLLAGERELRERGIAFYANDRGGDVTYHGEGQLVGYPILDLHGHYLDLHRYLRDIEEVVIRTLARFGVDAGRLDGYTGVWVGGEKICAIGIKSSRWVTMHGFALNVSPDLSFFDRIIPCGIFERGVTSLRDHMGPATDRKEVARVLISEFAHVFSAEVTEITVRDLESTYCTALPPLVPEPEAVMEREQNQKGQP